MISDEERPGQAPARPGLGAVEAEGMTPYLWALLAMLASATFFDGFDSAILATVAPVIQKQYGLNHAQWGLVYTVARLGAVASFFVLVFADRFGRRLLITLTILGYALFTGLTAFSRSIESFTIWQMLARVFLASEFALSLIIVGEEYPTAWRGFGIATISGVSAVGTIAAFLFAGQVLSRYDWRTMYLIGLVPLGLIFLFRLGMRETRRFEHLKSQRGHVGWEDVRRGMLAPFGPRYRARTLLVTLIWNCNHLVTAPAVTFWTIHATRNLGYGAAQYGAVVAAGYLAGFLVGAPLAGWAMNRFGRRRTCAAFYAAAAVSVYLLFVTSDPAAWKQMALMALTVTCFLGANSATNVYSTELFPTEIRATAYSWTTNLLGRVSEIFAPLAIGVLSDRVGIPNAVAVLSIGPILGALAVLRFAPETRGLTLEEIEASLAAH